MAMFFLRRSSTIWSPTLRAYEVANEENQFVSDRSHSYVPLVRFGPGPVQENRQRRQRARQLAYVFRQLSSAPLLAAHRDHPSERRSFEAAMGIPDWSTEQI